MSETGNRLQDKVNAGKKIILTELHPPAGSEPAGLKAVCRQYRGKVDAIGMSDNRDTITMSALAASCLVLEEGLEPVLHITTRDRNRIALVSEILGARALGINNLLITGGTHQTFGSYASARSVYDIDPVQLLDMINNPGDTVPLNGKGSFFTGAVCDPFAGTPEMQFIQTGKKIRTGARFLVTKPVFDFQAFKVWWEQMLQQGLPDQAAVIAGIRILPNEMTARSLSRKRPDPGIPGVILERLAAKPGKDQQRAEGQVIAMETIKGLLALDKIRGIEICSDRDHDAVIEVIETIRKSGV